MKPIAVFQHSPLVKPGHFASFLDAHKLTWKLFRVHLGETVPESSTGFSGLCFLGGEMSVNDPIPWIETELRLIRDAVRHDIPVIGHCLGGQLMSKALGGRVSPNPVQEIGWGEVSVADNSAARDWLGELASFDSFHWHGETFTLPAGAHPLMSSAHCANQAFALGPHLGMQCHVEMTAELIEIWAQEWAGQLAPEGCATPSIQSRETLLAEVATKLPSMRQATRRLYERWLEHVAARVQRA